MEEAIKGNWSVRQLERQISTCLYRNYYDQEIKMPEDNPTIGILLVTKQDSFVAKYSSI